MPQFFMQIGFNDFSAADLEQIMGHLKERAKVQDAFVDPPGTLNLLGTGGSPTQLGDAVAAVVLRSFQKRPLMRTVLDLRDYPSRKGRWRVAKGDGGESIDLWIDPGKAPPSVVADFLKALSNLHVANGGSALEFKADINMEGLVISKVEL